MNETLFMVHGMWGGSWCWDNYVQFFEQKGYDCRTPTLRHHDMDPDDNPLPELGRTSLLDYVADLEHELDQLDDEPIIIGHSMGSLLVQLLGERRRGKLLILLAPTAPHGILSLRWSVIRTFFSVLFRWGFWKRPMKPTFEESTYSILNNLSNKRQKEVYEKFVYESGQAACEIGFSDLDPNKASSVDESKIKVPMLLLNGSLDKITPPSISRKVAQKYSDVAEYREYPEHAHYLVGEDGWEEICEDIHQWIKTELNRPKEKSE